MNITKSLLRDHSYKRITELEKFNNNSKKINNNNSNIIRIFLEGQTVWFPLASQ